MTPKLICFDFDLTLTTCHIHNSFMEIAKEIRETGTPEENSALNENPTEYLWAKLKARGTITPTSDPKQWQQLFSELASQYPLAIVSRNRFEGVIRKYLEEIIGLDADILNKIYIVQGNTRAPNKAGHIQTALQYFYPTEKIKNFLGVILIEDTPDEVLALQPLHITPILVHRGDEKNIHIDNVQMIKAQFPQALEALNNKERELLDKEQKELANQQRVNWLSDKLALASRLSETVSKENFMPLNRVLMRADDGECPFSDLVKELEDIFLRERKIINSTPWAHNTYVPGDFAVTCLNKYPEKYHLMRMTGLILEEIYKKHPDATDNRLQKFTTAINNLPCYQEKSRGEVTPLVSKISASHERPPFRSH